MKEKLKNLPIESYMGLAWLIIAMITYINEGLSIDYHVNIILAFMALFTGTIIVKIRQAKDEVLNEIRKDKKEEVK